MIQFPQGLSHESRVAALYSLNLNSVEFILVLETVDALVVVLDLSRQGRHEVLGLGAVTDGRHALVETLGLNDLNVAVPCLAFLAAADFGVRLDLDGLGFFHGTLFLAALLEGLDVFLGIGSAHGALSMLHREMNCCSRSRCMAAR